MSGGNSFITYLIPPARPNELSIQSNATMITTRSTRCRRMVLVSVVLLAHTIIVTAQNDKITSESSATSSTTDSSSTSTVALPLLTTSTTTSTDSGAIAATSTTSTAYAGLTNAPTIAGLAVPSLIVPDTSNAPFMQRSNLPEGTVFICVGAALGFLGMCVLAWRAWVAWTLQRSVQRAASSYRPSETKSNYYPMPFGGPGGVYDGSNMSLEHLTSTNTAYKGVQRRERAKGQQSRTPTSSTLFFSPTAVATGGLHQPSNRASGYLPAGYYASGQVPPAAGAAIAHIGGPSAVGYGRIESASNTPPDTPRMRPSPGRRVSNGRELDLLQGGHDQSRIRDGSSNFGLEVPGQRTPSAVLDSWFDHSTAMGRADRL